MVAAALNGGNCLAALVQGIRRWMGEMGAEAPKEEEVWRRIGGENCSLKSAFEQQ